MSVRNLIYSSAGRQGPVIGFSLFLPNISQVSLISLGTSIKLSGFDNSITTTDFYAANISAAGIITAQARVSNGLQRVLNKVDAISGVSNFIVSPTGYAGLNNAQSALTANVNISPPSGSFFTTNISTQAPASRDIYGIFSNVDGAGLNQPGYVKINAAGAFTLARQLDSQVGNLISGETDASGNSLIFYNDTDVNGTNGLMAALINSAGTFQSQTLGQFVGSNNSLGQTTNAPYVLRNTIFANNSYVIAFNGGTPTGNATQTLAYARYSGSTFASLGGYLNMELGNIFPDFETAANIFLVGGSFNIIKLNATTDTIITAKSLTRPSEGGGRVSSVCSGGGFVYYAYEASNGTYIVKLPSNGSGPTSFNGFSYTSYVPTPAGIARNTLTPVTRNKTAFTFTSAGGGFSRNAVALSTTLTEVNGD